MNNAYPALAALAILAVSVLGWRLIVAWERRGTTQPRSAPQRPDGPQHAAPRRERRATPGRAPVTDNWPDPQHVPPEEIHKSQVPGYDRGFPVKPVDTPPTQPAGQSSAPRPRPDLGTGLSSARRALEIAAESPGSGYYARLERSAEAGGQWPFYSYERTFAPPVEQRAAGDPAPAEHESERTREIREEDDRD